MVVGLVLECIINFLLFFFVLLVVLFSLLFFFFVLLAMIPSLYLFACWFVAAQVCVFERVGPFRSLTRSFNLTLGARFRVLAVSILIAVFALALLFGGAYLWRLLNSLFGSPLELGPMDGSGSQLGWIILMTVVVGFYFVLFSLMSCGEVAVYFNQRVERESFDVASLMGLVDEIGERHVEREQV